MKTVTLLHPSRGRPAKSFNNARHWKLQATISTELIVSVDESDSCKNAYVHEYGPMFDSVKIIVNDNKSVVEATNAAAKVSTGDILIYLSDDFTCPYSWGQLVINEFQKYQGPTLIKVDDCLQPNFTKVLTIPMMNRELYNKLGYFWHPDYKSMFCDEDLYWTAEKLRALKMATHLKFPHIHPSNPDPKMRCENDETYKRSAANWEQGKAVFARRKAAGFPV